ncbi:MAG: hypothetical protein Q8P61_04285, partial [Candidatus Nanopelagicales bacterium]|nr:hypothetical protein [Candidatus Nanopelagicales bacterium]
LIEGPQMAVLGRLGRGKTRGPFGKAALARWLYVDTMLRTARPVIVLDAPGGVDVLDELSGCERLDMSAYAGQVLDPLRFEHARSRAPRVTAGEW